MQRKGFKFLMSLVVVFCLIACHFLQRTINQERKEMGLTRLEVLENAPPLLAFTTVALGGFRGLIVNVLWTRMTDLGDQDRYFETIQLADWITKLEPTFAAVWNWQAWNLAYNISIKFSDPRQRWHWVYSGVKLLRDEGIPYNSNRPDLYRELAWFYQNKIGYYLDDCHLYYKAFWADEMEALLGKEIHWETLLNPQSEEDKEKVRKLKEEYKLDPAFMKKVDDKYGPFEWRMPDAHAIYWAMMGLEKCKDNKKDDLMPLRRAIYQPMLLNFHRGRLVENRFSKTMEYRPNLDAIPNTDKAYQEFAAADPEYRDHILKAHKNFLKDAIYFLYSYNRISEAAQYYREFAQMYPTQTLISGDPTSTPGNIALDEYVVERVDEDVRDNSPDRVRGIVEGLLFSSFYALALDQEDEATGNAAMALKVWEKYDASMESGDAALRDRMGLPPFQSMRTEALRQFLLIADEKDPLMGDALRVRLQLPAREAKPASEEVKADSSSSTTSTNSTPQTPSPEEKTPEAAGTPASPAS